MTETFCGIDFGTTNSTVGLCAPGNAPRLVGLEDTAVTLPSALFFNFEDRKTYFGRAAVAEYMDGAEGRFMRALKSVLGSSLMAETTQIGRERVRFEALIGRFLAFLRQKIVESGHAVPEMAVLGRPVHFVDDDPVADKQAEDQLRSAAMAQGFKHIEFQFEPVAAALNFEQTLARESLALVVDVGGGTSDFSVLRLSPDRRNGADRLNDILSTSGVHVGGTDFDKMLNLETVMPEMGRGSMTADGKRILPQWYFHDMATWHRINLLYAPAVLRDMKDLRREAAEPKKLDKFIHLLTHRSGHRLAGAVEAAKIELTDTSETLIALDEPGLALNLPVLRTTFEKAVSGLVARIETAIDMALTGAQISADAIDTIILTGGGAQVPAVLAAVTHRFPEADIAHTDKFGAVGLGLALDAARRFG